MRRIITYTIKEDLGDKTIVEEKTELHDYENTEATKYFAFRRISTEAEERLKNVKF